MRNLSDAIVKLALTLALAPVLSCGIVACASIVQSAPVSAPVSAPAQAINLAPRVYYSGDTCYLRSMRTGALYPVSCDLRPWAPSNWHMTQWQVPQP